MNSIAFLDVSSKCFPNMRAVIDAHNLHWLSSWKWGLAPNGKGTLYVRRKQWIDGKQKIIYLHRQIMGFPDGFQIDHADCNTLNNTENNLRICTPSQNGGNQRQRKNNKISRFKGVNLNCTGSRWVAGIRHNKKDYFLGSFATEKEAAVAYDVAARKFFKQFARTNFDAES